MKFFFRDDKGATAVEFALLALPFFTLVFAVFELSFMFYIDTTLDSALQSASRQVKTGVAAQKSWSLATFKKTVCSEMAFAFDCEKNILIKTTVLADFSSVEYTSPVVNKVLTVNESFDAGKASDYMLIQAFLPFPSILAVTGVNAHTLADGTYVLSAAALFRNEPFQ